MNERERDNMAARIREQNQSRLAVEKSLRNSGWELHTETVVLGKPSYRAEQGCFSTPWRSSAEMVLCDVRRLSEPDPHEGRNESDPRLEDR